MIINEKIPFTIMMSGTIVEISRCVYAHLETRMHSSTMHTARFSGHLYREGCLPLGPGGVCLLVKGVSASGLGVSASGSRGCLPHPLHQNESKTGPAYRHICLSGQHHHIISYHIIKTLPPRYFVCRRQ